MNSNIILAVLILVVIAVIIIILVALLITMYKLKRYLNNNDKIKDYQFELDALDKELNWYEKHNSFLEIERDSFMEQCRRLEMVETEHLLKLKQTTDDDQVFKGMHALLGDYLEESSEHTRKVLRNLGFYVDVVETGDQIVDRIKSGDYNYDIIFTNNIYKKGILGNDVLRQIKFELKKKIPIVVVTISSSGKGEFLEYGFDACLKKLISLEETKDTLLELFKRKGLTEEKIELNKKGVRKC